MKHFKYWSCSLHSSNNKKNGNTINQCIIDL